MEIIELTEKNIDEYLDACLELQTHLVSVPEKIDANLFTQTAHDSHAYFIGILDEQKLIGIGLVSKVVHPVDVTGYVNNIVVHPDARGKGFFGVIMDALEAQARQWGCTDLALTCSREGVQGLYEKRGYVEKHTKFYLLKLA